MLVDCQHNATKLNYTRVCKYEAQKAHFCSRFKMKI